MKKLLLSAIVLTVSATTAFANEYNIDLATAKPKCGTYTITTDSTREKVMKNCKVDDTHSGHVRMFRGSQKIDLTTDNMGVITCKFNRSLVNSDGALKECSSSTPPALESANVSIKTKPVSSSGK